MRNYLYAIFIIAIYASSSWAEQPKTCTYSTYKWNVRQRKAVEYKRVHHSYKKLAPYEIHKDTGCTVCEEDQVEIAVPGINRFKVCKRFAGKVEKSLRKLKLQNQPITTVVGYRVGMTKGNIDHQGNRTQFSYHSFGIALDINPERNGLYENCFIFGPQCGLIKGGSWHPNQTGSLTNDSPIVTELKSIGFKWGGEIEGKQKDFMHFSPSGY